MFIYMITFRARAEKIIIVTIIIVSIIIIVTVIIIMGDVLECARHLGVY